jgi:hypothetical protein
MTEEIAGENRGGTARGGGGKNIPPKRLKPLTGRQRVVITRQTTTCTEWPKNVYTLYSSISLE